MLVIRSAAAKLCSVVSDVEEINESTCSQAGLGPKATENILNWLEMDYYPNQYRDNLPFKWKNKIVEKKKEDASSEDSEEKEKQKNAEKFIKRADILSVLTDKGLDAKKLAMLVENYVV